MMRLAVLEILLADADRMRNLGSHFRGESSDFTWHDGVMPLVTFAVIGILLWLGFRLSYGRERRAQNNPRALFRELCRAHRLDAASKRLLADLIRAHSLSQPALLFVDPALYEPSRLGEKLQSRRDEVIALAARLFGDARP